MLAYSTPKLKLALAKSTLIHFFSNAYWTKDELTFIRSFLDENNSNTVLKLKMRLLAEENNDMLVTAVLADSSPEEFRFLYSKYRLGRSFVQISTELNIHPNGLQRWRDKFLAKIATLLEYNLTIDDIFSRNKVEAFSSSNVPLLSMKLAVMLMPKFSIRSKLNSILTKIYSLPSDFS